jgi:DNA 3'-phosphatase
MKTILFLDLDGTVIETASGETFPTHIGDMKFKDGILNALKRFVLKHDENTNVYIFIVTNQGGINTGYIEEEAFQEKFRFVRKCIHYYTHRCIGDIRLVVDGEYCSSLDKEDNFRKPNTGMLEKLLSRHKLSIGAFDKGVMLMVGDAFMQGGKIMDPDRETAKNFSIDYMDVDEFIAKYNNS